jgi:hypothetical protein
VSRKPQISRTFTEDFELRVWQVPERLTGVEDRGVLNYVEQVNRFTATISAKFAGAGNLSAYAQLDEVALMANTYYLNDVRQQERELLGTGVWSPLLGGRFDPLTQGLQGWDLISRNLYINLEKLRVGYDAGSWNLQLGDVYAAVGRGTALNLNRNVDIDIDTSLQGLKFVAHPGAWDVTVVAAQTNRQQVSQDNPNANVTVFGERRHFVAGARVDRYGLGPVNLGAHGVMYNFVRDTGWKAGFNEIGTTPDAVVAGGSVEALGLGPTDWYVEGNGFFFPTTTLWAGQQPRPGFGIYGSGAVYAGRATLLMEFKRYRDVERVNSLLAPELYEIAIAPTLEYERQTTEDSAAAVNSNDIWGGKLRANFTAIPGALVPYASIAVFRDLDTGNLHFNSVPETIVHPMVGVEWTQDGWSMLFNAGYRLDRRDGPSAGADRHLHGDLLARVPLGGDWSFDLSMGAEWYRWGVNPFQQTDYVEMESAWSVQKGTLLTLIWYMDHSDNPLIDTTGNLTDKLYGAGEIQIQPLPALTIKAFYGAYKSGIRCSGGQCRVLPGFSGARLGLTATF